MKIEELGLSTWAYHPLKRAGINTVEQLRDMHDRELLYLRNFGVRCLAEVREKLALFPATEEREETVMKIKLDPGAKMPTRAHLWDAGMDLYAMEGKTVPAHGSAVFDTGVHIELPHLSVGFLKSKSGLNVNHDITSDGVIDTGYTGSIKVKLYNHGDVDYNVNPGDKISQLVILPIDIPDLDVVDELEETDRGDNGFGSSGRS